MHMVGAQAPNLLAQGWFEAIQLGEFERAWALMTVEHRARQTAGWVQGNAHRPEVLARDPEELAESLARIDPVDEPLWVPYRDSSLASVGWEEIADEWAWATLPRPEGIDRETVILFDPKGVDREVAADGSWINTREQELHRVLTVVLDYLRPEQRVGCARVEIEGVDNWWRVAGFDLKLG